MAAWKKVAKRLGLGLGLTAGLVAAVVVVRTARFTSRQGPPPSPRAVAVDPGAAGRLAGAVAIETISHPGDGAADAPKFARLIAYLKGAFPRAARLDWEEVDGPSLLITWPGSEPALKPLLLAAHLDVVPAVNEEDGPSASAADPGWASRAFSGTIQGGFIRGRGTLDDKVSVVGMLEAAEAMLGDGYRPRRTVYMAFGRDEEVGGKLGATRIAAALASRRVALECVVDEGSFLLEGIVPGVKAPVAPIGIAEKGYVDVALRAEAKGGHSSMPPPRSAIGDLSRAIARLEARPMPIRVEGLPWRTLDAVGRELPFLPRMALANYWLFGPLLEGELARSPSMNALIRTTGAVTIVRGGMKDNVLPDSAEAIVNYRLLPGDGSRALLDHVRSAVGDPDISVGFADPVRYSEVYEASKVSPIDVPAYDRLRTAIRRTFPDCVVVPFLVTAGTDSRRYEGLTDAIYRFLPIRLGPDDLDRIHGVDERIAAQDYHEAVAFYTHLIRAFGDPD